VAAPLLAGIYAGEMARNLLRPRAGSYRATGIQKVTGCAR